MEFIDCLGGFGIFALGHRHPKIINAIKQQMDRMALHSQWMLNPRSADAARRLAEITPGKTCARHFGARREPSRSKAH